MGNSLKNLVTYDLLLSLEHPQLPEPDVEWRGEKWSILLLDHKDVNGASQGGRVDLAVPLPHFGDDARHLECLAWIGITWRIKEEQRTSCFFAVGNRWLELLKQRIEGVVVWTRRDKHWSIEWCVRKTFNFCVTIPHIFDVTTSGITWYVCNRDVTAKCSDVWAAVIGTRQSYFVDFTGPEICTSKYKRSSCTRNAGTMNDTVLRTVSPVSNCTMLYV